MDITRDVMVGLNKGKSLTQLRKEIDARYQAQGHESTATPMPPPNM